MDLFGHADENNNQEAPLAERLRPKSFEELLGQDFLQEGQAFTKLLNAKKLPSLILWGPPGTGKTSFAKLLTSNYGYYPVNVNAISTGAKQLRELGNEAKTRRQTQSRKTLLFIDEIHRLNKSQQDVLLPFVEAGDFLLVGATTENPSFEVNSALLSRCRILKFSGLNEESLLKLIKKSFAHFSIEFSTVLKEEAGIHLTKLANGDARKCLNLVEQLIAIYEVSQVKNDMDMEWPLDVDGLLQQLPSMDLYYDRNDSHYDSASALIKSIRGSDPNAAVYYLARMLEGGEDPKFIARRLVISASEDIGNADPRALQIAISCQQAVTFVGMPEAGINLSQAVCYLASAPKSNRAYMAYKKALQVVQKTGNLEIPLSIRNAPTKMMKEQGYGEGYQYAHNYDEAITTQVFLPEEIKTEVFYEPIESGYEKHIKNYLDYRKSKNQKGR